METKPTLYGHSMVVVETNKAQITIKGNGFGAAQGGSKIYDCYENEAEIVSWSDSEVIFKIASSSYIETIKMISEFFSVPLSEGAGKFIKVSDDNFTYESLTFPEHSHPSTEITGLGSVATMNIPLSGNSNGLTVTKGDDTRLSDNRNPAYHTHNKSEITDFSHTHNSMDITSLGTIATLATGNSVGQVPVIESNGKLNADLFETSGGGTGAYSGSYFDLMSLYDEYSKEGNFNNTNMMSISDESELCAWTAGPTPLNSNNFAGAGSSQSSVVFSGANSYILQNGTWSVGSNSLAHEVRNGSAACGTPAATLVIPYSYETTKYIYKMTLGVISTLMTPSGYTNSEWAGMAASCCGTASSALVRFSNSISWSSAKFTDTTWTSIAESGVSTHGTFGGTVSCAMHFNINVSFTTQSFNGTAWSTLANAIKSTILGQGCGTALSACGAMGSEHTNYCETYINSVWKEIAPSLEKWPYNVCTGSKTDTAKTGTITEFYKSAQSGSNIIKETWSAGNTASYAQAGGASAGSSTSGAYVGGYNSAYTNTTANMIDGIWLIGGSAPLALTQQAGFGANANAFVMSGGINTGSAGISDTYIYNGTAWASSTSQPSARAYSKGCGTQTAGFVVWGAASNLSSYNTVPISFNGTTWTNQATTLSSRVYPASGAGTQSNCSFVHGMYSSLWPSAQEIYNGSSWSTGPSVLLGRRASSSICSDKNNFMVFGGYDSPNFTTCTFLGEKFNGTAWATSINYPTTIHAGASGGNMESGWSAGGGHGTAWCSSRTTNTFTYKNAQTSCAYSVQYAVQTPLVTGLTDVWSSTTSMPAARQNFRSASGTGLGNNLFVAGYISGAATSVVTTCNLASVWSTKTGFPAAQVDTAICGSSSSALAASGNNSSGTPITTSYKFDGTSWSTIASTLTAHGLSEIAGSVSAAILAYGMNTTSSMNTTSESFNGTAWSSQSNTLQVLKQIRGVGSYTDNLFHSGFDLNQFLSSNCMSTYNGCTWSSRSGRPSTVVAASGTLGNTKDMLSAGGVNNSSVPQSLTYRYYNGTWSAGAAYPQVIAWCGNSGGTSNGLICGGYANSAAQSVCYKHHGAQVNTELQLNDVFTATQVYPITGIMTMACGKQNAALACGGFNTVTTTYYANANTFNGTAWSAVTSMPESAYSGSMCGGPSAALLHLGASAGSPWQYSRTFNGTTWSTQFQSLTKRTHQSIIGTPSSALMTFGIYMGTVFQSSEMSTGVSWATSSNAPYVAYGAYKSGNTGSNMLSGGSQSQADDTHIINYSCTNKCWVWSTMPTGVHLVRAGGSWGDSDKLSMCGGTMPPGSVSALSSKFNGIAWQVSTVYPIGNVWSASCGGTGAGLNFVGHSGAALTNVGYKVNSASSMLAKLTSISNESSYENVSVWSTTADYPVSYRLVNSAGAASSNLCSGGSDFSVSTKYNASYSLMPISALWVAMPAATYPMCYQAVFGKNGTFNFAGGTINGTSPSSVVLRFSSTAWSTSTALPVALARPAACGIDSAAFVAYGSDQLVSYLWNGSAWSSGPACSSNLTTSGYMSGSQYSNMMVGGASGTTPINATSYFNGTAFSAKEVLPICFNLGATFSSTATNIVAAMGEQNSLAALLGYAVKYNGSAWRTINSGLAAVRTSGFGTPNNGYTVSSSSASTNIPACFNLSSCTNIF